MGLMHNMSPFVSLQMQELPFQKDLHRGARGDPVPSTNEKVKVSTHENLILFCVYNMLG